MNRYWVISASVLALGGCGTTSVVTSTPVAFNADRVGGAGGPSYLTYFLPQTVITVKLSAKKGGGGEDAAGGPSATVNNTITIDGKDVKAEPEAPPPPKPKSVCDQAKEQYNFLQAAHANFVVSRTKKLEALRVLSNQSLAKLSEQKAAEKAVTSLEQDWMSDRERILAGRILAQRVSEVCTFPTQVEISFEVVPDRGKAYELRLPDDAFSADSLTAKLDSQGLLTAISTTADDKSAEIASSAVSLIGTVFSKSLAPSVPSVTFSPAAEIKIAASGNKSLKTARPKAMSELVFRKWLKAQILTLATPLKDDLPLLAPELPDYPLRYALQDALPDNKGSEVTDIAQSGIVMKLDCPAISGDPEIQAEGGIVVSAQRACQVSIGSRGYKVGDGGKLVPNDPSKNVDFTDSQTWSVAALDSRYRSVAVLQRTRLIKRTNAYEMKDGRLSQVTYEKPSNAAAAFALPGSLIGSFFSGIVAGVQGPQSTYKAQADLISAKASIYKSQAELLDAQAKLKTANAAADAKKD